MLHKPFLIRFKQAAIVALISFGFCELSLQLLLRTNTLKIHGVLQHPGISREAFQSYLASRNTLVGWPSKLAHGKLFNRYGYRPSPENDKHADDEACIAVFGDSQGYGLDVGDKDAWTNILAKELKCKVENYSVPAYGTDQALLRFEQIKPKAKAIIITFIDDNLRRNLLQYWDLAYGPIYFERTKPRFILNDREELQLINMPVNSYEQARQLNGWRFEKLFAYETFSPSSLTYKTAFQPRFPFAISLTYAAVRNNVTKYVESPFVFNTPLRLLVDARKDPMESIKKTETLRLQRAILRRFVKNCSGAGYQCYILRLQPNFENPRSEYADPMRLYFESDPKLKNFYISGLAIAPCVNKKLVNMLNTSVGIDRRMPGGHYGPETNQAIAECVAANL